MTACRGKNASAIVKEVLAPLAYYNGTAVWIEVKENKNFGCQW